MPLKGTIQKTTINTQYTSNIKQKQNTKCALKALYKTHRKGKTVMFDFMFKVRGPEMNQIINDLQ